MKYLSNNKKGVSPIIATLLLIVIAVAAAVVTYAFVTGFIGTATSQSNQQGAMSIDTGTVTWTSPNSTIIVYVRNTGTKAENLTSTYIDNMLVQQAGNVTVIYAGSATNLLPNAVATVTIHTSTNYADAAAHTVKIVASDGTPVAYNVHS